MVKFFQMLGLENKVQLTYNIKDILLFLLQKLLAERNHWFWFDPSLKDIGVRVLKNSALRLNQAESHWNSLLVSGRSSCVNLDLSFNVF